MWKGSDVHHLGYFEDETDAARAYDAAVLSLRGPRAPTNFCPSAYGYPPREAGTGGAASGSSQGRRRAASRPRSAGGVVAPAAPARPAAAAAPTPATAPTESRYLGVSRAPDGAPGWIAEFWDGVAFVPLGTFATEAGAARAYDAACIRAHGAAAAVTNFPAGAGGDLDVEDADEMSAVEALASFSVGVDGDDDDGGGDDAAAPPAEAAAATATATAPPPLTLPTAAAAPADADPDGASPRESVCAPASSDEAAPAACDAAAQPPRATTTTAIQRAESVATSPLRPRRPPPPQLESVAATVEGEDAAAPPPRPPLPPAPSADDADAQAAAAALAAMLAAPPPPPPPVAAPAVPRPPPPASARTAAASAARSRRPPSASAPKSSAYKGVSWHKHSQKWYAYIQAGGKMRGLGYHVSPVDAARAYDAEARRVHGARALLNFPAPGELAARPGTAQRESVGGGGGVAPPAASPAPAASAQPRPPSTGGVRAAAGAAPKRPRPPSAASWSSGGGGGGEAAAVAPAADTAAAVTPAPPAAAKRPPSAPRGRGSPFRGVSWHKHRKMWQVYVHVPSSPRASYHLGYYASQAAAARAYDRELVRARGPSSAAPLLNFPLADYVDDAGEWRDPPVEDDVDEEAEAAAVAAAAAAAGQRSTPPPPPLGVQAGAIAKPSSSATSADRDRAGQLLSALAAASGEGGGGGAASAPSDSLPLPPPAARKRSRKPALVYSAAGEGLSVYAAAHAKAAAKRAARPSASAAAATARGASPGARSASASAAPSDSEDGDTPLLDAAPVVPGRRMRKPSTKALAAAETAAALASGGVERRAAATVAAARAAARTPPPAPPPRPPGRSPARPGGGRHANRYRGTTWLEREKKWLARVWDGARQVTVGRFDRETDAARAHDREALRLRGAAAVTNFTPAELAAMDAGTMATPEPVGGGGGGGEIRHPGSRYFGVVFRSGTRKWAAVVSDPETLKSIEVGQYVEETDAARAYDAAVYAAHGPTARLNFAALRGVDGAPLPPAAPGAPQPGGGRGSSRYRGVSRHERSGKWEVRVWGGGRQNFVGSFDEEATAARAYDHAVLRLRGADPRACTRLNFPGEVTAGQMAAARAAAAAAAAAAGDDARGAPARAPVLGVEAVAATDARTAAALATTSRYRGVSLNRSAGKWEARLHDRGRPRYIGAFDVETDAARAFDVAALALRGRGGARTNFPAERYTDAAIEAERARLAPAAAAEVAATAAVAAARAFGGGGAAVPPPPPAARPPSAPVPPTPGSSTIVAAVAAQLAGVKREAEGGAPPRAPSPKRANHGPALPPRAGFAPVSAPAPPRPAGTTPPGAGASVGSAQTRISPHAGGGESGAGAAPP